MTNKEIIQKLYENFASGDVPAVLAAFDADLQHVDTVVVRELTK